MKYKISVIIPVYNTQDYLSECIDSVLNQTLNDIEIIIVDDGSTDGGLNIIKKYSEEHSRIKYFQQNRKRQGAARNMALGKAEGKYVVFLDSDDTLPDYSCRLMFETAEEYGSQMVVGIMQSFTATRKWVGAPIHRTLLRDTTINTNIIDHPELVVDSSACNRMILRSLIVNHDLKFPEGTAGEDMYFMSRLYLVAEKITLLPDVVYNYRGRADSRTSRITSAFFNDRVAVTESLKDVFTEAEALDVYKILLRSETRKLVGNRFRRVIKEIMYDEQINIFSTINRIACQLDNDDILYSGDFTLTEKVRIIMLNAKAHDAIIAYETGPQSPRFLSLIDDPKVKALLFEPVVRVKLRALYQSSRRRTFPVPNWYKKIIRRGSRAAKILARVRAKHIFPIIKYVLVAPVAWINSRLGVPNDVWLIDERLSTSAEDNSYFLFKYLREKYPALPVYYVISKNQPQREFVIPIGNVIDQYSFNHAYLLHRARVLLSTDAFQSLAFPYELVRRWRRQTHNVFLQHGVAGNKTMTYTKRRYPYFSQVITTNNIEKLFFSETYGFEPEQVVTTGIARLDNLPLQRNPSPNRMILVAPTWRKWLKQLNAIHVSHYYSAWHKLLTSKDLEDLLEDYNTTLVFRPHFNMMHFIDEFAAKSQRIDICRELDKPLHELIIKSDLLLTDYSSVMYDFFYQEKPVIAYMFDRQRWVDQPPGPPHIDYDRDLPLDIMNSQDEVLKSLGWHMSNGFQMREKYLSRIGSLFSYRDHGNCERIYRSIDSAIENRQ